MLRAGTSDPEDRGNREQSLRATNPTALCKDKAAQQPEEPRTMPCFSEMTQYFLGHKVKSNPLNLLQEKKGEGGAGKQDKAHAAERQEAQNPALRPDVPPAATTATPRLPGARRVPDARPRVRRPRSNDPSAVPAPARRLAPY